MLVSLSREAAAGICRVLDFSTWERKHQRQVEAIVSNISSNHTDLVNMVFDGNAHKEVMEKVIDETIMALGVQEDYPFSYRKIRNDVLNRLFGYGIIQPVIDMEDTTDVFLNGPEDIYRRVRGREDVQVNLRFSPSEYETFIKGIILNLGSEISPTQNYVEVSDRVNHLRISAGWPKLAVYPWMAIRKHPRKAWTLDDLEADGVFPTDLKPILELIFRERLTVIISGPTGSGKSTLLAAAINECVPSKERIMVIESEHEAVLNRTNMLHVQENRVTGEGGKGSGHITVDDLVRAGMRQAPRRIYVTEVRGREAMATIRSFTSGHPGGATLHANDIKSAFRQAANYMLEAGMGLSFEQCLQMVVDNVDVAIHMDRFKIIEIAEVKGLAGHEIDMHHLYRLSVGEDGNLRSAYNKISPELQAKLRLSRFVAGGVTL